MTNLILLPVPRRLEVHAEQGSLPDDALIVIDSPALLFEAQIAQQALASVGLHWQIVAGNLSGGLRLTLDPTISHTEGYKLQVVEGQITLQASGAAGIFYGVCTLRQILNQRGKTLPALTIEDFPDFPARGIMLDVSRDRIPTLATIYHLVDRFASWKLNQLQLYMEHTFAYQQHREVWAEASPFTAQEILELDAYCRQRHIELVPNQNSLGHMERWLKFPRYHDLAESPEGFTLHGRVRPASTLNPVDPKSIELVAGLYDELLPNFTSRIFNVGGDEPWEFGTGKSNPVVKEKGSGRVYLDYLLALYQEVTRRGHQMQFWTDIIVKYPDLVPQLPRDVTAMIWGYESYEPLEEHCQMVAEAGLPFYVCPGTSSWNSLIGRTDNAMQNLQQAAVMGHRYGASGYLITDWGDNGHWQPLSVSYLGFAYGAALAWHTDGNLSLPEALDAFAFEDNAGKMGKLAYDLGNVYQFVGGKNINGQALVYSLQVPRSELAHMQATQAGLAGQPISPETVRTALQTLDKLLAQLPHTDLKSPDAALILEEYRHAALLVRHAAKRLLWYFEEPVELPYALLQELETLVSEQQRLWLARSRPGGLADSLQRFDHLFAEYRLS